MAVSDLARARRFYEDQLGLVPGEEEEELVSYPCADGTGISVYLGLRPTSRASSTAGGSGPPGPGTLTATPSRSPRSRPIRRPPRGRRRGSGSGRWAPRRARRSPARWETAQPP